VEKMIRIHLKGDELQALETAVAAQARVGSAHTEQEYTP
jgi:hypothetical protein